MSKKCKILLIVAVVVVILAAAIAAVITIAERNQRAVEAVIMEDFDLSLVPDGTFQGKYNAFPVIVEVDVTVKNHVITGIGLVKHMNGQGGGADVLPAKVVEAQSLLVDTISGATYSSKVMLLAIRNALVNAVGE